MTLVFDRPPQDFFDACAPEPGWRQRLPAYQLWPMLLHLRLFGDAYRGRVDALLTECGV